MKITFEFDVDKLLIDGQCPDCLLGDLKEDKYKNLMFLLYTSLVSMDDYLKEYKHVKQRKSKKKQRQKDIQKSC